MTRTDLLLARLNARLRVLKASLQAGEEAHRSLSSKIEVLTATIETQRLNQQLLEQRLSEQNYQMEKHDSLLRGILNSRIWRTLTKLGGIVLKLHVERRRSRAAEPERSEVRIEQPRRPALAEESLPEGRDTRTDRSTRESDAETKCRDRIHWKQAIQAAGERLPAMAAAPPLVSIITVTFNAKIERLAEAALSVLRQSSGTWEWCIVDDASEDTRFHELFAEFATIPRVSVHRMSQRGGIGSALNRGLEMATGTFICVLGQDDALAIDALDHCARVLNGPYDAVYADEDKISETGGVPTPFHKPDWSPEYFRGVMYVGQLLCVRRDLALKIGGFDSRFDRIYDYEFMLRYSEQTERIAHISEILYHRYIEEPSSPADPQSMNELTQVQISAVQAQLNRLGLAADVLPGRCANVIRVKPRPWVLSSTISIIVPTKDAPDVLTNCLVSLFDKTTYEHFDVICVDNNTQDPYALDIMQEFPVKRLLYREAFNFSEANNFGAREATGQFVVFMNNDVEILTPDWIEQMLYYAQQDDIGAVGGLLLYPDLTIQHAGVVLGSRGTADHLSRNEPGNSNGYYGMLACAHEVSAVTAACLMMKRDQFLAIGGFDSKFLSIYQDVDLCLQLRRNGKRNLFTPHAVFIHREAHTRGPHYDLGDRKLLLDRWGHLIREGDPYYNRNFDLETRDYRLKMRDR